MKLHLTALLALCSLACSCSNDGTSSFPNASSADAAPVAVDETSRRKQRNDVEDFIDSYTRNVVNRINAEQLTLGADKPQSFYLDSKEIYELGVQSSGRYSYVALFRYCEVVRCKRSSKSTEMILVAPVNGTGYRIIHSQNLGPAGSINVSSDGQIESSKLNYDVNDPPCCPSLTTVARYQLEGDTVRLLATSEASPDAITERP